MTAEIIELPLGLNWIVGSFCGLIGTDSLRLATLLAGGDARTCVRGHISHEQGLEVIILSLAILLVPIKNF
jgi:hypothetical protein